MELFNNRKSIIHQLTATFHDSPIIPVDSDRDRYVIFSDHHRGRRGMTDYFNEKVYNAALGYYLERGFHLILAGDVEEFWECRPAQIFRSYPLTYELEREFFEKKRLTKILGNHDNLWGSKRHFEKSMRKVFPGIEILDSVRLRLQADGDRRETDIFIAHGHQGTFLNDTLDWFAMFWMRNLGQYIIHPFKRRYMTPATSFSLREEHERVMFDWAEMINAISKNRILFVAGHTHHPIFMSRNLVGRLTNDIDALKKKESKKSLKLAARLRSRMEYARADLGHDTRLFERNHYYFNTGCCSFFDGSITGIEISKGRIKLIKWTDQSTHAERLILGSERIRDIKQAMGEKSSE